MNFAKVFKNVSFSILIMLFSTFALTVIGFCFHISINLSWPIISFLLGVITLFLTLKKSDKFKQEMFVSLLIMFLIFLSAILFSSKFYDSSWDGRTYHQASIVLLGNGWNPIYDNIYSFAANFYNNTEIKYLIWVENYPKYVEIIQANLYMIFRNIEISKMINIVLAAVLFMYSFFVLNKKLFFRINKYLKIFISFLIVLNPVYIGQCTTFYTDSYVYMYFMLMLFSIIDIETNHKENFVVYLILIISAISIANIKLGGLLYLFITILLYLTYLLVIKKKEKLRLLIISIFVISVSLIISGINPYFTNISKHRNPIYPLLGENKIDIITNNSPKQFVDSFYLKNFVLSTFARVDNFAYKSDKKVQLKLPFKVYQNELNKVTDVRICGFGVLWSGIVSLSFILAFFIRYKNKQEKRLFILLFVILLMLTILNPYCWWARYATHLWSVPIFLCITVLISKKFVQYTHVIAYAILIIMFLNVIIYSRQVFEKELHYRKNINCQMNFLKNLKKPIKIFAVSDHSLIEKMKKKNIRFELVTNEYYKQHKANFSVIPIAISREMYWNIEE